MTKASDNDFPSILFTEQGSAPSSPAASHQRLYIKSSDHLYYTVNSSGTVTAVGGSGGTAKGTSFPGGPSTNDHYIRTDINNWEYFYDGTRWRTVQAFTVSFVPTSFLNSSGTSAVNIGRMPVPYRGVHGMWVLSMDVFWNGGTYNGTDYWTFKLNYADGADADTQVGSTMDTKLGTTGGNNYDVRMDVGAVLSTNARELKFRADKVASATAMTYVTGVFSYQLIST